MKRYCSLELVFLKLRGVFDVDFEYSICLEKVWEVKKGVQVMECWGGGRWGWGCMLESLFVHACENLCG